MTTSPRPPVAISRTFPLAAADAWDLLADPRHHPRWIPLTRVEVQGSPLAVGWRVVATSGPFARRGAPGVRDRMRLDFVEPPTTSAQGVAVFTKLGPLLLGTALVLVAAAARGVRRALAVATLARVLLHRLVDEVIDAAFELARHLLERVPEHVPALERPGTLLVRIRAHSSLAFGSRQRGSAPCPP